MTDFAILTHGKVKHPLVDEKLRPDIAILDGELVKSLPPKLIADTGFDVLTHALEAYCATGASLVTDALAEKAFCTGLRLLPASYAGDTRARQPLHEASALAGMAFTQAGLGLCHALAHAMGGVFHVPHGRLNGVLLPAVVEQNARQKPEKYAQMAVLAGIGSASQTLSARNLKQALIRLRKQLQLPATLSECGISPRQLAEALDGIVETALQDPCCRTNPVPATKAMILQILEEVSGG
jgi:1-propanol dehydrogenase